MSTTITGVPAGTIAASCSGPAFKEPINSAFVRAYLQALCNDIASIKAGAVTLSAVKTFSDGIAIAQAKAITANGTGATLAGDWNTPSGATFTCSSGGSWVVASGGLLSVSSGGAATCAAGSTASLLGRVVPRSARVPVADTSSGKTLGVAAGTGVDFAGKRFVVASPDVGAHGGSVPRVRTLKSTNVVPSEGETIEVIWNEAIPGGGAQFAFKTEGAATIASFVGPTTSTAPVHMWAEFEFVSGAWRLGASSGAAYDGADFGVIPGGGA